MRARPGHLTPARSGARGAGHAQSGDIPEISHVEGPQPRVPYQGTGGDREVQFPATWSGDVEPLTARVGETALPVTDADGVWLRPFTLPDDSGSRAWPRFDGGGLYEGTVTLPGRFRATAVRGDLVLGVYRDATDVEHVRAYRVVERR